MGDNSGDDIIVKMAIKHKKKGILKTHSEYMLLSGLFY